MQKWLLYGAYGYTGRLLIEEAIKRGHKPVIAGRNAAKLTPLSEKYALENIVFGLDDVEQVRDVVSEFDLVLHAAGPYIYTAEPMIQACLAGKTHYLDITGELAVYELGFSYDDHAREQNIAIISGVGFDIVPSDCLGKYVAAALPTANLLEIGISAPVDASAGTTKSLLEIMTSLEKGSAVRRNGRIVPYNLGHGAKEFLISNGKTVTGIPIPWGDLATAEKSTGISNVTVYMTFPTFPGFGTISPFFFKMVSINSVRKIIGKLVDKTMSGPDENTRQTARSYLWARATDAAGQQKEAWLETREAYGLTAVTGIRAVEKVLAENPSGTLTPSLAFGADFVMEIEGTQRFDKLP